MLSAPSGIVFKLHSASIHFLAQHTGKSDEQVKKLDSDRDYYMTADEAKAYGLVDEVVRPLEIGKSLPPSGRRSRRCRRKETTTA